LDVAEVEVEPVRDEGADAQGRAGEELLDRLRDDVAGGVAEDVESVLVRECDRCDVVAGHQLTPEVRGCAVEADRDDVPAALEQARGRHPLLERVRLPFEGDGLGHGLLLRSALRRDVPGPAPRASLTRMEAGTATRG